MMFPAAILAAVSLAACTEGKVEPKTIQYTSGTSPGATKPTGIGWDLASVSPQYQHEVAMQGALVMPKKDAGGYEIVVATFEFGCEAKSYYRLKDTTHLDETGHYLGIEPPSPDIDIAPDASLADMRAVACSGKKNATDPTVQAASLRDWALDQAKNPTRGSADPQAAPAAGS